MSATIYRPADFPGGIRLAAHKEWVADSRIADAPLPPQLIVPLARHDGSLAEARVAVGQRVRRGECIAEAEGPTAMPVRAPSSGTVSAVEERAIAHPSGLPARCVIIDCDGADTPIEMPWPCVASPEEADAATLREMVREAGIAGLGGAAFPAHSKLGGAQPIDALIINGAECEPYIACDQALMYEAAEEIVAGIGFLLRALDTAECLIGIEDNKPEAIAAMRAAAEQDPRITVAVVPTRYPQGSERQLIRSLTGRVVPSGGRPLDVGLVCHNPGTARALYRAAVHGEAMLERIITLAGPAMAQPRNVRARFGTPLRWLAEQFGGFRAPPARLLQGGPMMGLPLPADGEVPLTAASNCLLALDAASAQPAGPEMPCIRCGDCASACPEQLLPQQLYWHARAREFDKAEAHRLFDCIECGACEAVCPSHIPLVDYYHFAKTTLRAEAREREAAEAARLRFEAREQRLAREAAEREAAREERRRLTRQRAEAGDDPIARAKAAAAARKAQNGEPAQHAGRNVQAPATAAAGNGSADPDDDDPVARARAAARARRAAASEDSA